MYPVIARERIRKGFVKNLSQCPDEQLVVIFALLASQPELVEELSKAQCQKLESYLRVGKVKGYEQSVSFAVEVNRFQAIAVNALNQFEIESIEKVKRFSTSPLILSRIISLFCNSASWDKANKIWERGLKHNLSRMSDAQIRKVLISAKGETADLRGSFGFNDFIDKLYDEEGSISKVEFELALIDTGFSDLIREDVEDILVSDEDDIPF